MREALRAAQRVATERPAGAESASPAGAGSAAASPERVDFGRALEAGLDQIDSQVRAADELPIDLLTGKVGDFHEIAVQLKSAELSFRFAMEIRNKLVDAYREIMRMSV